MRADITNDQTEASLTNLVSQLIALMIEAKDAGVNLRELNAMIEHAESKGQSVSADKIESLAEKASRHTRRI